MEKSGSEKTYPSRRRACYQSVTGSGRFLIDYFCLRVICRQRNEILNQQIV
ncbi:MAG: hypothetical protein ACOCQG_04320 [Candidatus Nanoarchaeia archaeon]